MHHSLTLALRSLRARPSRTLLTAFGIILGVAVILAISITNGSTLDSINRLFSEASGKANLVVLSASSDEGGFRQDLLGRTTSVSGVKAAIPSVHAQTLLADEVAPSELGVSFFGALNSGLEIYGVDPTRDQLAREYKIVAGRFLSPDPGVYEVVLVKDFADQKKLVVGRDVRLLTPNGAERVRIVGLMSKEGPGQLNNGAFGVMPILAAQNIFGREGELDQIDIVATPAQATTSGIDELKDALQKRLGKSYTVMYPASQGKRVTQMLNTYQLGLGFFSVISLFVGAFLIYNAFSMTVVERTREIGMLRTLGMTRGQVLQQILWEAVILGLIGSAVGVVAGFALAQGLIKMMEILVGLALSDVQVPLDGLLLSVLVGVLVTLAAAFFPAWQASRISPLEALRIRGNVREGWLVRQGWILGALLIIAAYCAIYYLPLPPTLRYRVGSASVFAMFVGATLMIPITVGLWERLTRGLVGRLYGNEGKLGTRNTERSRLRTALTVAALMVGVSMILGIRSMTGAFEHDIRAWIEVYIGGDLYVHSSVPLEVEFQSRLATVPGVGAVTPVRQFDVKQVTPDGTTESLAFFAVDPLSYRRVTSFVFTSNQGDPNQLLDRLGQGDGVFVSSAVAEKYKLKQGDRLRLVTRRGDLDFPILATVVDFYNQGMVVEGSWRDMQKYFGLNDVTAFLVKLNQGAPVDTVQKRIDDLYGKQRHLTVESNQALKSRALQLMSQAFTLFDVLALIAMIVASLGVVNTMTMNVLERTQEIGMLRSLGMKKVQVVKMILAEAGMMGLIGGIFGLAFGLFLSRLFLMAITLIQGYELAYVMPSEAIVVSAVIALLVSQFAGMWPARRAAGIRIVESIHFE